MNKPEIDLLVTGVGTAKTKVNKTYSAVNPHPVYLKVAAGEYIDYKDLASLIRSALKQVFPVTTFSVRTKTYSGGGSIHIEWTDGPAYDLVDKICSQYQTKHFDGMIDMAHSESLWIYPDGSVSTAHVEGTHGSGGVHAEIIRSAISGKAMLMSNCVDAFVFASRSCSSKLLARAIEQIRSQNWVELKTLDWSTLEIEESPYGAHVKNAGHIRFGQNWLDGEICRRAMKLCA